MKKGITNFDRDTEYWNNFYESNIVSQTPSLFACDVLSQLQKGKKMLELGCGNGRDSLYFFKNDIEVVATDASDSTIRQLKSIHKDDKISFICVDFVNDKQIYKNTYDYCYSRFSIHAISEEQEEILLKNVFCALNKNGKFFVEVRSINDELYGKGEMVARNCYIYNNHFRRFIVFEELKEKMIAHGFNIEYAEEKRGFAPFQGEDPLIIRIIAVKE